MKYIIISFLILFNLHLNAQTYNLDLSTAQATWTGYGEVGGFVQTGTIGLEKGILSLDSSQIQDALIIFSTKRISHENKDLEKHLKAKDFFFVRKYPRISFELIEIKGNIATGKLEIRGIRHEEKISLQVEQKNSMIVVIGKATIDRTKYDIKYNSSSFFQDLGNYAIRNEFDIDFELNFNID